MDAEKLRRLKERNHEATREYEESMSEMAKADFFHKVRRKLTYPIRLYRSRKAVKEALNFNQDGLNTTEPRKRKIIVSLTSYPGRINVVPATISTLLRQTVKPDKIVLWLGEEKFPNQELPDVFKGLRRCGIEIRFRPDLKSHTKYFYAIQEFPEDLIITVDDDNLYQKNLIEELYNSYKKYPQCVSALRVHRIRFYDDCTVKKYNEWHYEYYGKIGSCSHQYFATGVGGVLYPPHVLHPEVTNLEIIQKYCHNHDDLWLKIMEVMNGTKVVIAGNSIEKHTEAIIGSQETAQWKENVVCGGGDRQIEAVLSVYNEFFKNGKTLCEIMAFDE